MMTKQLSQHICASLNVHVYKHTSQPAISTQTLVSSSTILHIYLHLAATLPPSQPSTSMPSTPRLHHPYPYATIYPTTYASHPSNDNLRATADCSQSTSQPSASSAMQRQNTVSVQAALPASHTTTTCMYSPPSAHAQTHTWSHGRRHLYTTTTTPTHCRAR